MEEQIAAIDFETYSEAGYYRDEKGSWKTIVKGAKSGIGCVGAWKYTEHPSAAVTHLAYYLPGQGEKLWVPGDPPPADLLQWIEKGGLIEAHNSFFEFAVWSNICVPKLCWPPLPLHQLRCSMAKTMAWGAPGALGAAADALGIGIRKDDEGATLMKQVSKPRKATKKEPFEKYTPKNAPEKFKRLGGYCLQDVRSERALSASVPDLSPSELTVWLVDQRVNARGVQCDIELLEACRDLIRQTTTRYTRELVDITDGAITSASEAQKIIGFCAAKGALLPDLREDTVEAALERTDLNPTARRVLEIRSYIGGASVKKLEAMHRSVGNDGRLRDLFTFCGATRTGRWAGALVQPQNMVNKHPPVCACDGCGQIYWAEYPHCPVCGVVDNKPAEWDETAIAVAIANVKTRDLDYVEHYWGNAFLLVMGCLRSLFCAAPGYDLIGSDFSAIEAVVLAYLSGERWRQEVFETHGKIYEMSASKITGVPFEEILAHKAQTGVDHPLRKKVGKVAELASGYQGWVGAWKAFGADDFMDDEEMKRNILAWRDASPMIVDMWSGLEHCAKMAIQNPGRPFWHREICYIVQGRVMYCRLPSGRFLSYHNPRMGEKEHFGKIKDTITFDGVVKINGMPKWLPIETHGGKLTENVVQGVAGCIQRSFLVRAEASQYWPVLHVHDEGVAEVPEGWGSVEEFEAIMSTREDWFRRWAVSASGGWRGKFYRKG